MNSAEPQDLPSNISPDRTTYEGDLEDDSSQAPRTNGKVGFEHYEPNSHLGRDESEDVEMG